MYTLQGVERRLTPNEVQELSAGWMAAVCARKPDAVVAQYARDGVLVGTVAQRIKQGRADIRTYFKRFLAKDGLCGQFDSHLIEVYPDTAIHTGTYTFSWRVNGKAVQVPARYTFVWRNTDEGWRIVNHHSSVLPE